MPSKKKPIKSQEKKPAKSSKLKVTYTNAGEIKPNVMDAHKLYLAAKTADGYDNFISRVGLNNDNALSAGFYAFNLLTRNRLQLEAAYRGSFIAGLVIDCKAEDMTRAGVNITTNEADEDIKNLISECSKLKISQSLASTIKWGDLYGGAIAVIQIEGQNTQTPLDISTVAKDQFKGLAVYDRWLLNPDLTNVIASGPDIGLPMYYDITTPLTSLGTAKSMNTSVVRIHHSRVIRLQGIQLPYMQAITEMMWGESVLERLWDRMIAFDNASMSAASLVDRANLRTVQIEGLREIIAAGGKAQQGLERMFEMMRLAQTNEGLTLLDKNDTFSATAYSFAGLPDTLLQFAMQVSGASGIPLVRLLGQMPPGLGTNGEADIRLYYDNINAQQESKLRSAWDKIIRIMWRSKFGKPAPEDMEFTFVPLWQMSMKEKAEITKSKTESIIGAYESDLVSRPSAMKELRAMSGDLGMFSNISDEEIEEAEKVQEEMPPVPEITGQTEGDPAKPVPEAEAKDPVKAIDAKPKSAWQKIAEFVKGK